MFSCIDIIPMRTNTSVVVSAFCLDIVNSLFSYESKQVGQTKNGLQGYLWHRLCRVNVALG